MTTAVSSAATPAVSSSPRDAALSAARGAGLCVLVAGLGAANGGYFPTSWGWASLALVWVLAAGLALSRGALRTREVAFVGALAAVAAWTWLSFVWSIDANQTVQEGGRALLYVVGPAALIVVARRRGVAADAFGIVAGIVLVAGYALLTRLLPDHFGVFDPVAVYRLAAPLGYWNALGMLVVLGVLLTVGLAAERAESPLVALAGPTLVLLLVTLYFTYSRGAWIALAAGAAALVALSSGRLRAAIFLAGGAAAPAVAILLASHSSALTHKRARIEAAAHQGHRLALWLVVLSVLAAASVLAARALARRAQPSPRLGRTVGVALAVLVLAVAGAGVVRSGGPSALAHDAWRAFTKKPPPTANLNRRLFTFSGNGRIDQWRVVVDEIGAHPLLGAGAGGFEQYWLAHRPRALKVRDAHSLYLETLAELGPPGLVLLLVALGIPVAAAIRFRRRPLVPAPAAAYFAFLVHAGIDWDWEVPAVTLTALLVGALVLVAGRDDDSRIPPARRLRPAALAAVAAVCALVLVLLIGNLALSKAGAAARAGRWDAAAADARRAHRWAPWSAEPWQKLGEAQLAQGDNRAARASFRNALDRDPRAWELWLDLARASSGPAQRVAFAQAFRLDPLSPELTEFRLETGLP